MTAPVAQAETAEKKHTGLRVELILAFLLAAASLLAAWSGYQAGEWSGIAGGAAGDATTSRIQAATQASLAAADRTADILTYSGWLDAYMADDMQKAQYYRERFRTEFEPVFEAWLTTDPLNNPDAPSSPFVTPEYRSALAEPANDLIASADELTAQAAIASQYAGGYVRNTLFLALALFFAGLASSFHHRGVLMLMVVISGLFALFGLFRVLTLPIA